MKRKLTKIIILTMSVVSFLPITSSVYGNEINEINHDFNENKIPDIDFNSLSLDSTPIFNSVEDWKIDNTYKYPDKIKKLLYDAEDHASMIDICDAPKELLNNASTKDLLNLLYKYPLLIDIYAYNSEKEGIDAILRQSNIARELLKRNDAIKLLLDEYKKIHIDNIDLI